MMTHSNNFKILEVTNKRQFTNFIKVPFTIYKDDPNWVAPLIFERTKHFSKENPYFEHAECKFWIAYIDNKPVGRISAQIDKLYLQQHGNAVGFFGLLESVDEKKVFEELLKTAEKWLKSREMKYIMGPFNLSINDECGLLVDGFDNPPFIMMGHAKKYYAEMLSEFGYQKEKDLLAFMLNLEKGLPEIVGKILSKRSKNITVRSLNKKDILNEAFILKDIFNDGWSKNWGFIPFTDEEFSQLSKDLTLIVDDDFVQIGYFDNEPASMLILLPNINEIIKDMRGRIFPFGWAKLLYGLKIKYPQTARGVLMGLKRKYHKSRIGIELFFLMVSEICKVASRKGVKKLEISWVLEDNKGAINLIKWADGEIYKRYRIYGKSLV